MNSGQHNVPEICTREGLHLVVTILVPNENESFPIETIPVVFVDDHS